ncbi:MAG: helix-turn-helix domain-containing protein [Vicinamibacterales bacterium]
MPHNTSPEAELSTPQLAAVAQLAQGATVTRAAEAAGVSRETVHRWSRENLDFQAAVNGVRRELQDAVNRRLLAVAERAMTNVAEAVEQGDLRASLSVLKGLGVFGGHLPSVGSDDPKVLAEDEALKEQTAETARMYARLAAGL